MKKQAAPNSVAAERFVLGSLMNHPASLDEHRVEPGLFFTPAHAEILDAIRTTGSATNLISVTAELDKRGKLQFIGGAGELTAMCGEASFGGEALKYQLAILTDLAFRRRIIAEAARMQAAAEDLQSDVQDVVAQAGEKVLEIGMDRPADTLVPASAVVHEAMVEMERLIASRGKPQGLSTGFEKIDYKLGGLRPGQLMIIAGRPSMGKSALLLNIAHKMAKRGEAALVFSLEMMKSDLINRVVIGHSKVDYKKVRSGLISQHERNALFGAYQEVSDTQLYIDDATGQSIYDIRSKARIAMRRWNVKAIFVDYLQLVQAGAGKNLDQREREVATVSRGLKTMAMELGVPVIAAAQLNRETEKGTDSRPKMSHLRESGSIEMDADIISLLYRQTYYDTEADQSLPQECELIIAKNRSGETGSVPLLWRPTLTRFDSIDLNRTSDGPAHEYAASEMFPVPKQLTAALRE